MSYNELVRQHFFEPQHVLLNNINKTAYVCFSEGSVALGDAIEFYAQFDKTNRKLIKLKFKAFGNPYLIAAMSYICEQLQEKSLDYINDFSVQSLIELFEMPKTKYYVAYMIEDALNKLTERG